MRQPLRAAGLLSLLASPLALAEPVTVETLQEGLNHPWALAFLPDNAGILISERGGELRRWREGQGLSQPLKGIPPVWNRNQGGLLDVVLAPDFASSRRVWLSYTREEQDGRGGAAVGYGRLSEDARQLTGFREVIRQQPGLSHGANLGTRLAFDSKGYLFIAFGDNFNAAKAQDLSTLQGKIVRLNGDGSVPADNPLVGNPAARPEIWAWGMRNPQGLALDPHSRVMWESEHGPRGGDEVNILRKGANYGWPRATWGLDYSGAPVPGSEGGEVAGTVQPVWHWKVSPAISGMAFYQGTRFPQWQNMLFIGALKEKDLIRLSLDGNRITGEQRLLTGFGDRIRDVRVGPDGWLYLLTDAPDGKLLRVGPASR